MLITQNGGQPIVVNHGATARAKKYEALLIATKELLQSERPEDKAKVDRANAAIRQKFLSAGQVHVDSILTSLSVQYANEAFIGMDLIPEVQVAKQSGDYFIYDRRNRLAYPDDQLNARSRANEINETRSTASYSCRAYGLQDYVDLDTLANQDAPLDEMVDAVASVNEGVAFKREVRQASVITTAANYSSTNKVTLVAGSTSWANGGGNPIKNIQDARAALWSGRGPSKVKCAFDIFTWNTLARHPNLLDLFKYGGSTPGLLTPEMFMSFFRVDEVLIAEARNDSANEAQAASFGRIWPNFFWMGRVMSTPSIRNAGFGATFRNGPVKTTEWYDPAIGTQGGNYVKVTTKEDYHVIAQDTAYLISSPIA